MPWPSPACCPTPSRSTFGILGRRIEGEVTRLTAELEENVKRLQEKAKEKSRRKARDRLKGCMEWAGKGGGEGAQRQGLEEEEDKEAEEEAALLQERNVLLQKWIASYTQGKVTAFVTWANKEAKEIYLEAQERGTERKEMMRELREKLNTLMEELKEGLLTP